MFIVLTIWIQGLWSAKIKCTYFKNANIHIQARSCMYISTKHCFIRKLCTIILTVDLSQFREIYP
jgi:hypothetical protein